MQTILKSFEHLRQISSKSILTISIYAVSKLVRFLRHSVFSFYFDTFCYFSGKMIRTWCTMRKQPVRDGNWTRQISAPI